jgi:tRNA threonylcarbamoyladenosine biosynthesis protein TsaE
MKTNLGGKTTNIAKNTKQTVEIAKSLFDKILKKDRPGGEALIIALSGDLGAGKTTFVQAVARHLGIKNKVGSPTFVIMKKYIIKNKKHKFLFHLDAYRLKNEKELLHLGWKEIVGNKDHLVFIEWPENVSKIIPPSSEFVHIFLGEQNERHFKWSPS